tara:strand:+ start:3197 stop:3673 length:477 start_codon:yes stop_codon:yes gene_type:complete
MISRILQFTRRTVRGVVVGEALVDPGGGANLTAQQFAPAGDDSRPLPGDYAVVTEVQRTGVAVAVGYVDPENAPSSAPGEKRFYSRDPDDGSIVGSMWFKNNGDLEITTSGTVTINGATIDSGGSVVIPSSLELGGLEIAGHNHGGVESGGSNTGPNQ